LILPAWCAYEVRIQVPTYTTFNYEIYDTANEVIELDPFTAYDSTDTCTDTTFTYTIINVATGVSIAAPFTWVSSNPLDIDLSALVEGDEDISPY
jgi:hypothetical protein